MARQARNTQKSSLFSIKQQSDIAIFKDKKDRGVFIEILQQAKKKFGFDVFGYCLLDDDAFWIVINTKTRSVASIMQSISISYSLYRSDVENLFLRRYKSEAIYDLETLNNIMQTMMSDPRYETCEYCFYDIDTNQPFEFIAPIHQDIEIQKKYPKKTDTETMIRFIEDYVGVHYNTLSVLDDLEIRNDIIKHVYACLNITQTQLSQYFKISNSAISKILNHGI